MKRTPKLELKVADFEGEWNATRELENLHRCIEGLDGNDENWRFAAREFLSRRHPGLVVHVGGHHIALHLAGPSPTQYGRLIGRVIESEIRKPRKAA